jgi:hypothetical protein
MTAAALALVMPSRAGAATPDPIFEAIERVDAARRLWEVAIEPSAEWIAADRAIDSGLDRVFATTPTTLVGILKLIELARREHYLDDPSAAAVIEVIERAIGGMLDQLVGAGAARHDPQPY